MWFLCPISDQEDVTMGFLEFDSALQNIQLHPLKSLSKNTAVATLFSSRSMVYLITGEYESFQLTIHTWRKSCLDTIQTITNDFSIISKFKNSLGRLSSLTHNYVISMPLLH